VKLFVLWRARAGPTPEAVLARLAERFGPLFQPEPERQTRSAGGAHLAWLELPVKGFRARFFEEDGRGWAFAPEYPLNARRLLRAHGALPDDERVLLALARELEARPEPYVRELIPPSCLLWSAAGGAELHVANDGLGQAPLFEYGDGEVWALTNRVLALDALGVRLEPVAEEWAARHTLGWFPLDTTGFRRVRAVAGGTRLRLSAAGVGRARHDPIPGWVHPPRRPREEILELGRHALLAHVTDAMELWEKPTVGLSGGWDSRAVTSCLRVLGADFQLRVRGQETHFDVLISAALARMAGIPIRIKTEGGVPPDDAEACRASMAKALLWQGGNFTTLKHKSFLAKDGQDRLDGGVVNVMGQHAGIGKADIAVKIRAGDHPSERYEELLVDAQLAGAPLYLRPERLERVRELVRRSYRAAEAHGLTGRGPLHFYFLHEYTRRWGSATVASQTGFVVTPFLNPDFIRACYGLPEDELASRPLHRHITGVHAPEWAAFPYTDQATEEHLLSGLIPPVEIEREEAAGELPRWRETRRFRKFDSKRYWKEVGRPLVDEALREGGFWTELFEPEAARARWREFKAGADVLVLTHLLPKVLSGSLPVSA